MVFRRRQGKVVVNGNNHRRCRVARTKTITATHDERSALTAIVSVFHVEVKRFACCAGFLRTVEDSDTLAGGRHSRQQMFHRERAIEVYADHADLLASFIEIVDSLTCGFGDRTHADDDAFGVVSAIVAEQLIIAAGDLGHFGHVFLYNGRNGIVISVAAFTVGKEGFGVLGHTTGYGVLRRKRTGTELAQRFLVDERTQVFLIYLLYLLILMGSAESVEEVDERHAAFDGRKVGNGGKIHHLLYRTFAEHGETCLTAGHHVAVVTKDAERVSGQRTGRHMKYAGEQLASDLVHIRYHQQEALRRRKGGGQRAGLQRTVHRTGRTAFGLHFLYRYGVAEQVLTALCGPFVDVLRHGRGRRDGVDGSHFRKHVRNMRSGLVAITRDKFLFLCHNA